MSIEVELNGKAGRVCRHAMNGEIHCPLIIRPTSEDVVVGNVFGVLKHIRPHLWLGPMLNEALGTDRFRQAWYKNLSIRFWERQAKYPPELLEFREGRTEPDIIIEWENPPTTVWIEAKWQSPLATGTANSDSNDQVIRGIRTLLADTGHIRPARLFDIPKREAVWIALLNYKPEPLVEQYRDCFGLCEAMPGGPRVASLPRTPFVGTLTWADIARVLTDGFGGMIPAERGLTSRVSDYLSYKVCASRQCLRRNGLDLFAPASCRTARGGEMSAES